MAYDFCFCGVGSVTACIFLKQDLLKVANSSLRQPESQTNVSMVEQTELISKLSELLNAVEKSTKMNQQSHEQLAERTDKGIRTQTDFLTLQEQQQTQLATLITQNSLQVAPVLHLAHFLGPWMTSQRFSASSNSILNFVGGVLKNVYSLYLSIYRVILALGILVSTPVLKTMMI